MARFGGRGILHPGAATTGPTGSCAHSGEHVCAAPPDLDAVDQIFVTPARERRRHDRVTTVQKAPEPAASATQTAHVQGEVKVGFTTPRTAKTSPIPKPYARKTRMTFISHATDSSSFLLTRIHRMGRVLVR